MPQCRGANANLNARTVGDCICSFVSYFIYLRPIFSQILSLSLSSPVSPVPLTLPSPGFSRVITTKIQHSHIAYHIV